MAEDKGSKSSNSELSPGGSGPTGTRGTSTTPIHSDPVAPLKEDDCTVGAGVPSRSYTREVAAKAAPQFRLTRREIEARIAELEAAPPGRTGLSALRLVANYRMQLAEMDRAELQEAAAAVPLIDREYLGEWSVRESPKMQHWENQTLGVPVPPDPIAPREEDDTKVPSKPYELGPMEATGPSDFKYTISFQSGTIDNTIGNSVAIALRELGPELAKWESEFEEGRTRRTYPHGKG